MFNTVVGPRLKKTQKWVFDGFRVFFDCFMCFDVEFCDNVHVPLQMYVLRYGGWWGGANNVLTTTS